MVPTGFRMVFELHALPLQESHGNKSYMQNVPVVSSSEFYVLSNGALGFGVSLIVCTGNGGNYSPELCLHSTCVFSIYLCRTALTGNPSAPFERA